MIERSLSLSAAAVRRVLAGTQTQFCAPAGGLYAGIHKCVFELHPFAPSAMVGTPAEGLQLGPEKKAWLAEDWCANVIGVLPDCPWGVIGDRLWVREEFAADRAIGGYANFDASGEPVGEETVDCVFRATERSPVAEEMWRPADEMPQALARLRLEVTNVRLVMIDDLTDTDVKALESREPLDEMRTASPPESWMSHNWVWCVDFKVLA